MYCHTAYIQTHIYQVHFQDVEFVTDEACVPVLFGYIDQEGQWIRFHQHTWTAQDAWILIRMAGYVPGNWLLQQFY